MKRFHLLFIAVLTLNFMNGQHLKSHDPLTQGSLLNRFITATSPGNSSAAKGSIYKTCDAVANLAALTSGTFSDPDTAFVVGQGGAFQQTTDGGAKDPITISSVNYTDITCNGTANGTISITASGGTGALQYSTDGGTTWFENNGLFLLLPPGGYNIEVKDENNNQGIYSNNPVLLTDPPTVIINSIVSFDVVLPGGNNGAIIINAEGGVPPLKYSIDHGITWQMNQYFTGLVAGSYFVVVSDSNDCQCVYPGNPVIILNVPPVSTGSLNEPDVFSVYPNPAKGKVVLTGLNQSYQYKVSISTLSGQLLIQNVYCNQNKIEMDISALSVGIYILKIHTGKGVETKKLIVQ